MTPVGSHQDRWRRIEQIFLQAIDIPRTDRTVFLQEACGADDDLRRDVESLLLRDEQTGDGEESVVIAGIIGDAAAGLFGGDRTPDSMVGAVIGNYRVVREIGRGGMGAVYLAVREDLGFEKQVAIKLVKRGIDTDAVLQRFWYERRILAGLDHQYIARLLDGGTSEDGRPYFVMEYVDGKPVDVFLRQSGRSIQQRCELFRKICEAVAYAHRNLIIHRDLKPANILVTADETPKLLDFGIARLLSADPGENTILGTSSNRAMTPEFASPEQISGGPVTTATDVYSLGVTLRAILKAGSDKGEDDLPSDLRIILQKATRPEPDQRYQSVTDFSEDLRRYLEGLPIHAHGQTWSYHATRFVQRHRAGAAATVLFCLLIVGGMAAILIESRKADREREAAERRLTQAVELANRTLSDVNGSVAQLPGTTAARRQIVRSTEEYLDQLAKDSGNDPRVLAALGTAYVRVSEVQGNPDFANLGDTAGSLASYRKAIGLIDPLLKADPRNRELQDLAAEAHQGLGSLLGAVGSGKDAETQYQSAIAIWSQLAAENPNDPKAHLRLLNARLLDLLHYPSDREGAEEEAARYLPEAIKLAAENPGSIGIQLNLASYYNLMGTIAQHREALRESLSYYRQCIAVREAVRRLQPRNSVVLRDLAVGYGQAGDVLGSPFYFSLGDFNGALKYFRQEAAIVEELSRSDPSDQRAHDDLGMAWMRIGVALQAEGNRTDSNSALARSVKEFGALNGSVPDQAPYLRALELDYQYMGENSWSSGDTKNALLWYRESLSLASEQIRKDPHDIPAKRQAVMAGGPTAILLALEGDSAGAHQVIDQVLQAAEETPAAWKGRAWNFRGQLYQSEKAYKESVDSFEKALAIWAGDSAVTRTPHYAAELRETQARLADCRRRLRP